MVSTEELTRLFELDIAKLRWEFWRYSFARTLCLSGLDTQGHKLWLWLELTNYIDLPMQLHRPSFSPASPEEVHALLSCLPHPAGSGDDQREFLKISTSGGSYFLWASKLTVIEEAEAPDFEQTVKEEIERLERECLPI